MSKPIKMVKCLRCGYEWYPRSPKRPAVCASKECKSRYWDTPKTMDTKPRKRKEGKDG